MAVYYNQADPRRHTALIKTRLGELTEHLRTDVDKVEDPKAKALFEVTAEVLTGLSKAYDDYERGSEQAWE